MNQPQPPSQRRPDGAYPGGAYSGGYQAPPYHPGYAPSASSQSVPPQVTARQAKDSEQLLAEALRAMASGAASLGSSGNPAPLDSSVNPAPSRPATFWPTDWTEMILLATIVGLSIGVVVGLTSFYW